MLGKAFGENGFQIPPDYPDYSLHPFNEGVEWVINQHRRLGSGARCCLAADFVHTVRCGMRGRGVILVQVSRSWSSVWCGGEVLCWGRFRDYG